MKKPALFFGFLFFHLLGLGQDNLLKGIDAIEKEEYDEAVSFFSREIEENPKSARAFYLRSYVYFFFQTDRNREALSDISKAIQFAGKKQKDLKAKYFRHRAEVYSFMKNPSAALTDFNEAIKLDKKNAAGFLQRGTFYLKHGKPDLALIDFEKARALEPFNEDAEIGIGRVYSETGFPERAEGFFNEVLRLNSESYSAYYYRSLNHIKRNNYESAIKDMLQCFLNNHNYYSDFMFVARLNYPFSIALVSEKIIEQPSVLTFYLIRSTLYERSYQYKEAISDYNTIIDMIEEEDVNTYLYYKGVCFYNLGAYDYSTKTFNTILEKDSTLAYPYGWRALNLILKNDYKSAERDLSLAIQKEPGMFWYYSYRADIRALHLNDTKGALNDYNMAYSFDKKSYSDLLKRGRLYKDVLDQPSKAEADFKIIIAGDSSEVEDYMKATALLYTGHQDSVKTILSKIVNTEERPSVLYESARAAMLFGDKKSALTLLEKCFEKGFYQFESIEQDSDFASLKMDPDFKKLLTKHKKFRDEIILSFEESEADKIDSSLKTASIPMISKGTGTYEVACKINGLPLNMIFDTGASDISISQTEVQFMLKHGYLSNSDFAGSQKYMDANGNITVGATIVFKTVDFGGVVLKNVKAAVVNNKNAPLLFGQSALSKYGKIVIDNENKIITIGVK